MTIHTAAGILLVRNSMHGSGNKILRMRHARMAGIAGLDFFSTHDMSLTVTSGTGIRRIQESHPMRSGLTKTWRMREAFMTGGTGGNRSSGACC